VIVVFLAASLISWSVLAQQGSMRGERKEIAAQVVVKPASSRIINDRLTSIGSAQAQASVAVTPWSGGKLERFHVKAGDFVNAGQVIAVLDQDNEQIMVERARVELKDADETLERLTRLARSDTASRVQVISAELALAKAQLALRDAELALERRTIRAPIDGIVGILAVDAGNYVTVSTILLRIDNRERLFIDVWLPERFAAQVVIGQEITARAIANSGAIFHGHISAIDNALDEASRTLRVRAEIVNEGDRLRAGMSFAVNFAFIGERFVAVDPLSIQWRSEGAYIWRIDEMHRARRVPVRIIQRNSDYVLLSGDLIEGQFVVVQGVHAVRDAGTVMIKNLADLELTDSDLPDPETLVIEGDAVSSIAQP